MENIELRALTKMEIMLKNICDLKNVFRQYATDL